MLVAPVLGLQPVQHCQLPCQQQNQPLSVNVVVVPEMCAACHVQPSNNYVSSGRNCFANRNQIQKTTGLILVYLNDRIISPELMPPINKLRSSKWLPAGVRPVVLVSIGLPVNQKK